MGYRPHCTQSVTPWLRAKYFLVRPKLTESINVLSYITFIGKCQMKLMMQQGQRAFSGPALVDPFNPRPVHVNCQCLFY